MARNSPLDALLGEQRRGKKVAPETRSRYSVKTDRWDRKALEKILKQQPEMGAARKKLADNIAGELGYDEGADAWWLLSKINPELEDDPKVRPTRIINKRVNEEMVKLAQYHSVRRFTAGDPIAAGLAFADKLEPEIEILYDRFKDEMEQQDDYEDKLKKALQAAQEAQDADEMLQQWMDENEPEMPEEGEEEGEGAEGEEEGEEEGEGQGEGEGKPEEQQKLEAAAAAAGQKADQAAQAAAQALAKLEQSIAGRAGEIQAALGEGLGKADAHLTMLTEMSQAWGQEPGQLMRLDAKKRIELARRLNTPKFENMSRLIGPMMRDAFAEQKRKVVHTPEEIVDLELGDDLPRVIAPELARLGLSEETELLFYKDLVEHHLQQYRMKGFEKIARGGIIYCHDGSGSMEGQREIWAKAVGLALLHVARKQKRSFYGIQFGSAAYGNHAAEIRIDDFSDTKNLSPERVIDFAEYFFNGGTDFETPLNEAVKILQKQHDEFGAVQADIVFATDGHCGVSDEWMAKFKEIQAKLEFKVYGIAIGIGGRNELVGPEPLSTICDGKVATLTSLLNSKDIRSIFRGL